MSVFGKTTKWPIAITLSLVTQGFVAGQAQVCNLAGSPITGLRTPLVESQPHMPPGQQAPNGQPPATGDGSCPRPVTAGQTCPPTLLPYINHVPGGIGSCGSSYQVPFDQAGVSAPGTLGPNTWAPPPASTPGGDPGSFNGPRDFCPPPVAVTNVAPGGGIMGSAPRQRWGGQQTHDYGRYKYQGSRSFDFGQGMYYGQTAQDGTCQVRPGSAATRDLYGQRVSPNSGPGVMTFAPY